MSTEHENTPAPAGAGASHDAVDDTEALLEASRARMSATVSDAELDDEAQAILEASRARMGGGS
jgi:hypothetical protein